MLGPGGAVNLLEVRGLKKHFPVHGGIFGRTIGHLKAVDGVSLTLAKGETLGLVGESGCGKTTAGRSILRLIEPTDGTIVFKGRDVTRLPHARFNELRRDMQIVFQDPYSSLNPRMTVLDLVAEGMLEYGLVKPAEKEERVAALLEKVGLPGSVLYRYPHEFSGGQRQRIAIARAVALNPSFIVCDEPVSALDVSVQAQVINLLVKLQKEFGHSYLFISHDLGVVRHVCDRIAVMYFGRIVEEGPSEQVFNDPKHPYTKALISAIPVPDPEKPSERVILQGDVPTLYDPPAGCPFHARCPVAKPECAGTEPPVKEAGPGRSYRCVL